MSRGGRVLTAVALGALSLPASCAAAAQVIGERAVTARTRELTIATPAFAEPTRVRVTLPTGYGEQPGRRWPVTYYLAGTGHDEKTFTDTYEGERVTESYASIVVAPKGDAGYWSDWYNAGDFGPPKYETFVIEQLIPLIDRRYPTKPRRSQRAIFGESMGGFGTAVLAARHPDIFAAASSLSGPDDSNDPGIASVISASPATMGAAVDSIWGPRSSQEVRWHGHNPADLAGNLRDVDLQIRIGNGVPQADDPELAAPTYPPACAGEVAIKRATDSFHAALDALRVEHVYKAYDDGCHSNFNFEREASDSLPIFERVFAHPEPRPKRFDYRSIEPRFAVWGWRVKADPKRPLAFLALRKAGARGVTVEGSGLTTITAPSKHRVRVLGGRKVWQRQGRVRFTVELGAPDAAATVVRVRLVPATRRA